MRSSAEHWDRVATLVALGQKGDSNAVPELLAVLEDERQCCHTKVAALESLALLGAKEAGPKVLKVLAREPDLEVKEAAANALGELGYAQAKRLLSRLAAEAAERPLGKAAQAALVKLAQRAS